MSVFLRSIKRYYHVSSIRYNAAKIGRIDFEFLQRKKNYDPFYEESHYGPKPRSKIGGNYQVPFARGTGIGSEMMEALIQVFDAANAPVRLIEFDVPGGPGSDKKFTEFLYAFRRCGVCIKGFLEPAQDDDNLSRNMRLRNELKLFANVIHLKSYPNLPTKGAEVDLILIRQNIEGEYAMLEHRPTNKIVQNLKIITRYRTEYLARFAFNTARQYERDRIVLAYVEGATSSLFLETILGISKEFPEITLKLKTTSAALHNLIGNPEREQVLLVESLYGGVIANCIFGMIGSNALAPGCNYGNRYAMFESASRSAAMDVAGKGIANPTSILLAGVKMLEYLEAFKDAELINEAVISTLQDDNIFTPDLGGDATTEEFVRNVIQRIRDKIKKIYFCSFDEQPRIPKLPRTPTPPYDPSYHLDMMKKTQAKDTDCHDSTP